MIHKVYEGDVYPDEAVTEVQVKPLRAFRVKTPDGRYYHVLTDQTEQAVREHFGAPAKES